MQIPALTLPQFVTEHWRAYGDKPALIDAANGRTLTYADLAAGVTAVAGNLAARGLGRGDRVCIYSPNLPEFPIAFHGILRAGGVPTAANPLYTVEELARQLADSGAAWLVTVPEFAGKALAAARQTGVKEVFVFGAAEGATPFSELCRPGAAAPIFEADPAEELAALPYSSGTTGTAKGVMLTHRNMVAAICQTMAIEQTAHDDIVIAFLPFFHIYGQQVIMNAALRQGATLIVMTRFDFTGFLDAVGRYRISRLYLVPPIVLALSKSPLVEGRDFSSVRYMMAGAAPLAEDLVRCCSARIGVPVRQGYGMTETSGIVSITPPGRTPPRADAVGLPVPGCEAKLVDGELWTRGPQIMRGYWNRPEATAAMLEPDGWLRTGDIAEIDDDGWIRVVDRCKELIKFKGLQVPPAELEALLVSHPAVADAAVIGVPDEEAGEIPKAFIVRRADVGCEELAAFVGARVAPHKRVRVWEFVERIPKSPSGKILRRLLRG